MGLDTTHDCWHGAYSAFMRWREKLAQVAGLPPLPLMEGFFEAGTYRDPFQDLATKYPNSAQVYYDALPIRWDALKPDPLYDLLYHSDCDGELPVEICESLASRLEELLPALEGQDGGGHIGSYTDKTQAFINGLRRAAAAGEDVGFH